VQLIFKMPIFDKIYLFSLYYIMEVKYVCSLGTLCQSSQILKNNNLKKCSYPFDWIFSNYDIIIRCIEDDFKIFLDKSYYISRPDNKCGHSYYCGLIMIH
jgi:hypothetical protein